MYNLAREVSKLLPEQRAELASKCMVTTIEGRALSVTNQCLIARQIPHATIVGGFRQWLKAGRCVMKGQHGACIWVPTNYKSAEQTNVDGEAVTRTGFILGTVFDVSQTQEKTEAATETSNQERADILALAA